MKSQAASMRTCRQREVFAAKNAHGDIVGTVSAMAARAISMHAAPARGGARCCRRRGKARPPVSATLKPGLRRVDVFRVQQRCFAAAACPVRGRAAAQASAFARDRDTRQRDASRLRAGIQSGPRDVDAPDPMFGDPRGVALRDPGLASAAEIGVRPAGGEKFPCFFSPGRDRAAERAAFVVRASGLSAS